MPREVKVFDVLVASPSDVAEERDRLEEVIRELNATWQRRLGIHLDLVRWETHAYPGFGEDAQDVINQEIPDRYDVFVGILWSRIGTATKRAESGTLEEFERAYAQYRADPDSIHIMFYFKRAAVDFANIEPEQVAKVKAFQASLPAKGGFYWYFDSPDEFEKLARRHLNLLAQRLSDRAKAVSTKVATPVQRPEIQQTAEEEGLLDLVEKCQGGMNVATDIAEKFTESIDQLGTHTKSADAELRKLAVSSDPSIAPRAKRIINSLANRLTVFAELLGAETPILDKAFAEAMGALDKAIDIAPDFGTEGINAICNTKPVLEEFEQTVGGSSSAMLQMREVINNLPRVTTRFNHAKRSATQSLDSLVRSLDSARTQIKSSLALLERLCAKTAI